MQRLNRSENVTQFEILERLREVAVQRLEILELATELHHRPVRTIQAYEGTPKAFQLKENPAIVSLSSNLDLDKLHQGTVERLVEAYGLKFLNDEELAKAAIRRGYVLVPKASAEKMVMAN